MRSGNRYRSVLFSMCAFLSFPVIWSVAAFGEEPAETEPVLETREVVISATKTPVPVSQVTSAVEIITGEQMQQRKVKTVAEALRWAQGLAVNQSGGPGTAVDVRMRGGTPEQTLVLIDGAILNSATLGSYDFAHLTTDNIERIEILRGNQSMLWGSDAMGGVINITTRRGRDTPNISAFFEYGSFNTLREGANLTGKKGPVDFAASLSRWDTASFSAINYRRGATERDGYHNWQGSVRLGVDLPKEGRLEFNFRWMEGIINLDGFAFNPVTFQSDPADVSGRENSKHAICLRRELHATDHELVVTKTDLVACDRQSCLQFWHSRAESRDRSHRGSVPAQLADRYDEQPARMATQCSSRQTVVADGRLPIPRTTRRECRSPH